MQTQNTLPCPVGTDAYRYAVSASASLDVPGSCNMLDDPTQSYLEFCAHCDQAGRLLALDDTRMRALPAFLRAHLL